MERHEDSIVYSVRSRRSGGLSIGINLFPDRKLCDFDCPYCEVFPFRGGESFSLARMTAELASYLDVRLPIEFPGERPRDIAFSGNGEPMLSPFFGAALAAALSIRAERRLESTKLVVITNATRLGDATLGPLLSRSVNVDGVEVWAKLDAGSNERFRLVNRSQLSFDGILDGIKRFARNAPVTIQTMVARIAGRGFDERETLAYIRRLIDLRDGGARLSGIQLYGKARPTVDPSVDSVPDTELLGLARKVSAALPEIAVSVFGSQGRIDSGGQT
jgi:wyosine [tRNA(Phe)-imidazoG37] synthetase (radical SAM superfamily)